jgi:arylsulfatase A-like enzyme
MPLPISWNDPLTTKPPYLAKSRFVTKSVQQNYGGPGGYTNPVKGKRNSTLGQDNLQQHMREYYASVTALDAEIGRVIAKLKDPDGDGHYTDSILDNTWIIFMGDNGWQTGHHKFTSKVLAYEESCRVPLIVKAPGISTRVEKKFALNIDLTAMFYEIAGLKIPEHLQGCTLGALVANPETPWRNDFYYEAITPERSLDAVPHDALRNDQYKLILTYNTAANKVVYEELYDLIKDPDEMVNLATDTAYASVKKSLKTRLEIEKNRIATTPPPLQKNN